MKYYECVICGIACFGLLSDGEIYEKEVCDENCLKELNEQENEKDN